MDSSPRRSSCTARAKDGLDLPCTPGGSVGQPGPIYLTECSLTLGMIAREAGTKPKARALERKSDLGGLGSVSPSQLVCPATVRAWAARPRPAAEPQRGQRPPRRAAARGA